MIPDLPLPPWARRWQQSAWWQFVFWPVILGFVSSVMMCAAGDPANITVLCVRSAAKGILISFVTMLTSGHSTGSASFVQVGPDAGKISKLVEQAADLETAVSTVKAKALDPRDPSVPPIAAVDAVSEVNKTLAQVATVAEAVKSVLPNGGAH